MREVRHDNPVPFLEPCSPTTAHVPCKEGQKFGSVPKVGHGDVAASQLVALTHPLGDVLHELGHLVLPAGDEGLQSWLQPLVQRLPQLLLPLLE